MGFGAKLCALGLTKYEMKFFNWDQKKHELKYFTLDTYGLRRTVLLLSQKTNSAQAFLTKSCEITPYLVLILIPNYQTKCFFETEKV